MFLRDLLRHLRGPVIVLLDNSSTHQGRPLEQLLRLSWPIGPEGIDLDLGTRILDCAGNVLSAKNFFGGCLATYTTPRTPHKPGGILKQMTTVAKEWSDPAG
jgi:hypothetical protein